MDYPDSLTVPEFLARSKAAVQETSKDRHLHLCWIRGTWLQAWNCTDQLEKLGWHHMDSYSLRFSRVYEICSGDDLDSLDNAPWVEVALTKEMLFLAESKLPRCMNGESSFFVDVLLEIRYQWVGTAPVITWIGAIEQLPSRRHPEVPRYIARLDGYPVDWGSQARVHEVLEDSSAWVGRLTAVEGILVSTEKKTVLHRYSRIDAHAPVIELQAEGMFDLMTSVPNTLDDNPSDDDVTLKACVTGVVRRGPEGSVLMNSIERIEVENPFDPTVHFRFERSNCTQKWGC